MKSFKFFRKRNKAVKRFVITLEFETEAKTVDEALKLAERLRNAIVSVKEKNDVITTR